MLRKNNNAALGFIFVTVLIDVISIGLIFPVMPDLIEELTGKGVSDAARYGGWLTFVYSIMQFVFAPLFGNLSDRYGRRPVLLLSLLGFGLDNVFMAFAPSIGWLFVGRTLAGITGASYTVASAYVADISEPEKRAQNFGIISAAFGVGFIIGPVIGGLIGEFGTHAPFLVAAAFSLLNLLYGYFVLPESLKPENRRPFEWKRANPVGSFSHLKRFPLVAGLILALLFCNIAGHSMESVWSFFTIEKFKWSKAEIGYSLGFIGLAFGLVQTLLTRWLLPRIGDKTAVVAGLTLYTVSFVLFAVSNRAWMMYAFMIPHALGAISNPAIQGLLSNQIPDNEQGELQGGLTSLMSAAAIIGPPIMTSLFATFSDTSGWYFPGAPFLFAAFLMLISVLLSVRNFKRNG